MSYQGSPILAAAASSAFLAKGCVNVIELDELKKRAGDRWPRVREGVHAYLDAQLHSRLGPNDLFVRLGDLAYLVTMPTTEPDDVSAICLRVTFDLYRSFLGECDLDWIRLNTVLSADDDNLVLARVPIEKIAALAEKVGIERDKSGPVAQRPRPRLLSRAVPIADEANGLPTGDIGLEMSPVELGRRWRQQTARVVPFSPPQAEYHYKPVWMVPNTAVTSYACVAKRIAVAGRPGWIERSLLSSPERLSVEMTGFLAAVERLRNIADTAKQYLLVVPFSFEALASPNGRMEIQSACRGLSHDMRPYLTFMLYDVPAGIAQTRLANLVTILRPFGRGVIATIPPSRRAYATYQGIGLTSVGFDLAAFAPRRLFCACDAEELSQFARRSNLGTFLWNVDTTLILKFAQDAGIQMLSGPAILPPCAEPSGMRRLGWGEVLSQPGTELWVD